jgi:hypothetical protein
MRIIIQKLFQEATTRIFSTNWERSSEGSAKLHCKKRLSFFSSPAGMSLSKVSLAGKRESLVSDIPAGDGKNYNLFFSLRWAGRGAHSALFCVSMGLKRRVHAYTRLIAQCPVLSIRILNTFVLNFC